MERFDPTRDLTRFLSPRPGPQPRSTAALPFRQIDQWPPADIYERLVESCAALPHVLMRESRMASCRTRALYLPDAMAGGPPEAFIDRPEFCHLHPLPEG